MGVPTSEVGYTIATNRREDHKFHTNRWWHWREKKNILGVLWEISHIFTNAEYAKKLYVDGFSNGNANAAVEEYLRRVPMRRIPDRRVFSKVFNTLRECGTLPSAHVSSERACQQHVEEEENILEMVQRSHNSSTRKLSTRLSDSQTRVWRTLHEDCLYPFHPQRVQILHPRDSAMRLEFCHWLHNNRQLVPLTFRHRASCILGQAFRYSPENAFYIFNQQIYFII